mmetsp:Transcript_32410/g.64337  ORF Transcript_32410/g.64337 Transcript_32410/m.64337 type:complete len:417 (+) Transcript_32410:261-1511(+)
MNVMGGKLWIVVRTEGTRANELVQISPIPARVPPSLSHQSLALLFSSSVSGPSNFHSAFLCTLLLPQFLQRHVLICILLHHLRDCHLEVLLSHVDAPLSECKHSGLRAHSLVLCPRAPMHERGDFPQVDSPHQVHFTGMDPQNLQTCLFARVRKFNFPVDAPRAEERIVENVNAVRSHDHLNVLSRLESVQLVQEFQHRPLHLRVPPLLPLLPLTADGVYLVHEDDRRRVLSSHDEKLSNHSGPFPDIFLNQLTSRHANEATVCVMSHSTSKEGLAGPWGSIEQHSLRLLNSQSVEDLRVFDGELDDLLHLLHLLLQPSDHLVSRVGDLLDFHEGHQRIDLGGQNFVKFVRVVVQRNSSSRRQSSDVDVFFDVDHVLPFRVHLHKNFIFAHHLHDLSYIRPWLQKVLQLLSQFSHF